MMFLYLYNSIEFLQKVDNVLGWKRESFLHLFKKKKNNPKNKQPKKKQKRKEKNHKINQLDALSTLYCFVLKVSLLCPSLTRSDPLLEIIIQVNT